MKAQKPKRTRVSLSEDDLKDIKPDSPLYSRVLCEFADIDEGEPYRKYAEDRLHKDGELEFDDDAVVSLGADDGAYVMGWVWVSDYTLREEGYLEKEDDAEDQPAN